MVFPVVQKWVMRAFLFRKYLTSQKMKINDLSLIGVYGKLCYLILLAHLLCFYKGVYTLRVIKSSDKLPILPLSFSLSIS